MSKNLLSQYTKDEILNAIESGCDYLTYRRIINFCEIERLKQADKKLSEQQKQIEEAKRLYLIERNNLITEYGVIEKIPIKDRIRLLALQQDFLNLISED